jgi:hypothetical protein
MTGRRVSVEPDRSADRSLACAQATAAALTKGPITGPALCSTLPLRPDRLADEISGPLSLNWRQMQAVADLSPSPIVLMPSDGEGDPALAGMELKLPLNERSFSIGAGELGHRDTPEQTAIYCTLSARDEITDRSMGSIQPKIDDYDSGHERAPGRGPSALAP